MVSAGVEKSRELAALERVAHGFSTRHGGVSKGPRASLDLDDPDETVRTENWRRLLDALGHGEPDQVAWLRQVHGDGIVEVSAPGGVHEPVAEGDAAFTTATDIALVVRTADCVPVLLAGAGVVACAHSGWRGTAVDVVGKLVQTLRERVGVAPDELVAAVGPAIGGDVYEVGQEVVRGLDATGLSPSDYRGRPSPRQPGTHFVVDLKAAVRAQLRRRGVERVDVSPACTLRDLAFYSVRRDGPGTGRQVGVILRTS